MKQSNHLIAILTLFTLSLWLTLPLEAQRNVGSVTTVDEVTLQDLTADSVPAKPRELYELLMDLDTIRVKPLDFNKFMGPWIFSGYRHIYQPKSFELNRKLITPDMLPESVDSISEEINEFGELVETDPTALLEKIEEETAEAETPATDLKVFDKNYIPEWLKDAVKQMRMQEDLMYSTMIVSPAAIDFAYWDLPEPPVLPDDEVTFEAYLRKLDLPEIGIDKAILPEEVINKIHWLHNVNTYAQFSQAFVSKNWYQGGNNHLALLLGANWNVQLNQVYHPKLLFQSNLSYKLGLYSSPEDKVHKYSISEDVLQWNLNAGLKALKKWYYSLNAQFKTQIFNNYPANSKQLKASFLSPGDLNVGLGMAYSNKKPNLEFTATISPLSYNLKTCISDRIDHSQFKIAPDRKSHSDFGSNAEFNMNWKVRYNINYKTRLFIFTDYKYFLTDWEHTFNFEINKFLSTQIYVHMRLDTSSELNKQWRHFMLREVLSFGLSYTFSTK